MAAQEGADRAQDGVSRGMTKCVVEAFEVVEVQHDDAEWLLASGGEFRQLTTAPWLYRGLYRRYFREVSFRLVVWNLPPGGVYFCRGWIPPAERAQSLVERPAVGDNPSAAPPP